MDDDIPRAPRAADQPAADAGGDGAAAPTVDTDDAATARVSRRWFLVGGGVLVLAGAGAGVAVRLARDDVADTTVPDPPPAALLTAADRERALIADLDATTGGSAGVRAIIARTRADHAAHLEALESLLAGYRVADVSSSAPPSGTSVTLNPTTGASRSGTPRTVAQLRTAELRASADAAQAATVLSGRTAALLASVSACEASHATVLA